MIDYNSSGDSWIVCQILKVNGTVLHKAVGYAVFNALITGILHYVMRQYDLGMQHSMDGVTGVWTGYTSILGFLVVFRNNQAYSRFWEGATLVRQVRGEWFNSVSALIAFSKKDSAKTPGDLMEMTNNFQEVLVRLASALYCSALRQVCDLDENALQVLDLSEVNPDSVQMLADADDRCQLIIFWLQALIIKAEKDRVLDVPSPILSRSFQELSRGMVNLTNLHKIKEIPFPYPYQQVLIVMLIMHNLITTCMAAVMMDTLFWACAMTFMVTGSFWTVIYIAVEIDQPFGDDPNDLPLIEMQEEFNADLVRLLKTSTGKLPSMNRTCETQHALMVHMESELPKNRSIRRKDTTKLTSGFSEGMAFTSEGEGLFDGEDTENSEAQKDESEVEEVVGSIIDDSDVKTAFLAEFDLPPTSVSSPLSEEPARFRFARYLREAAEQFEKDAFDKHEEFSRVVSDMPDSPKSNFGMRRSFTSDHLGTGSVLQSTRALSKGRAPSTDKFNFEKLEGAPTSLAESFKVAKERLQKKTGEDVEGSTGAAVKASGRSGRKTSVRSLKGAPAASVQGKTAIGALLPSWPSQQIDPDLEC
eukprot:TRINITY_DN102458_c0_g1_i1.p1 TRINITY_DN102458_c0_g1~~TRINITY_DN102458_c0_g1_i1.p1  ORF type:complete len:588 (+),score=112.93 TRINITY_DN102458_c0_g1_i1:95-1858(+)